MLYFANPTGDAVNAMIAGELGYIDTPAQGNIRPAGVEWCADNGAFSDNFNETEWWSFLEDNAYAAKTCRFAVAPDVVGNADATLARSTPWLAKIRALGYTPAFVAQNGAKVDDIPWGDIGCLFIGGCPECPEHGPFAKPTRTGRGAHQKFFCPTCGIRIYDWKLSAAVPPLVAEAKRRGKWVHMGRVNSARRFRWAEAIGCDSADGTYLTQGPDKNLPKLLRWVRQPGLYDFEVPA